MIETKLEATNAIREGTSTQWEKEKHIRQDCLRRRRRREKLDKDREIEAEFYRTKTLENRRVENECQARILREKFKEARGEYSSASNGIVISCFQNYNCVPNDNILIPLNDVHFENRLNVRPKAHPASANSMASKFLRNSAKECSALDSMQSHAPTKVLNEPIVSKHYENVTKTAPYHGSVVNMESINPIFGKLCTIDKIEHNSDIAYRKHVQLSKIIPASNNISVNNSTLPNFEYNLEGNLISPRTGNMKTKDTSNISSTFGKNFYKILENRPVGNARNSASKWSHLPRELMEIKERWLGTDSTDDDDLTYKDVKVENFKNVSKELVAMTAVASEKSLWPSKILHNIAADITNVEDVNESLEDSLDMRQQQLQNIPNPMPRDSSVMKCNSINIHSFQENGPNEGVTSDVRSSEHYNEIKQPVLSFHLQTTKYAIQSKMQNNILPRFPLPHPVTQDKKPMLNSYQAIKERRDAASNFHYSPSISSGYSNNLDICKKPWGRGFLSPKSKHRRDLLKKQAEYNIRLKEINVLPKFIPPKNINQEFETRKICTSVPLPNIIPKNKSQLAETSSCPSRIVHDASVITDVVSPERRCSSVQNPASRTCTSLPSVAKDKLNFCPSTESSLDLSEEERLLGASLERLDLMLLSARKQRIMLIRK